MAILKNTSNNPKRIVKTRRWVHVNQLELGMYVNELDLPWSETQFLFQGFRIESNDTLKELKRVCSNVLVESEKVANVSIHGNNRLCGAH